MKCWNCGADLPEPSSGKISFEPLVTNVTRGYIAAKIAKIINPGFLTIALFPELIISQTAKPQTFAMNFNPLEKVQLKKVIQMKRPADSSAKAPLQKIRQKIALITYFAIN